MIVNDSAPVPLPRSKRIVALPSGPTPGFTTTAVSDVPAVTGFANALVICGGTPTNRNDVSDVALSPFSTFVTVSEAAVSVQAPASAGVRINTVVPETRITCASVGGLVLMSTCTGASKPTPSIVTSVPPTAGPTSGLTAVICIFATYRKSCGDDPRVFELMLTTVTGTGPVTVPDPFEFVERASGAMTMIVLNSAETTCASAAPKNTCTGAWKPSPKMVARVPPLIEPDVGDSEWMIGVRDVLRNVNASFAETRSSVAVPTCVTTMMSAASCWPAPRLTDGVITSMNVSPEFVITACTGTPVPVSNSTRSGPMKFVPLMRMMSPPCGLPTGGTTELMVGVRSTGQRGSGGTHGGVVRNVTSMLRLTLLTVAKTRASPGVDALRLTVATPLVVVRMIEVTPGVTSVNSPEVVVNSTAVPLATG